MCLVALSFDESSRFPLVVAANRDEFFARPTAPLDWWRPDEASLPILSGRDLQGGGTWLGLSPTGRLALITNVRDPARNDPRAPSRGKLVTRWLAGESSAALVRNAMGEPYNGFNLVVVDAPRGERMHVSNRHGVSDLSRGVHGVSNAALDTPWPKVLALKAAVVAALRRATQADELASLLFAALVDDRPAPDDRLPSTGVSLEWERWLSSAFILTPDGRYGTRSSTLVITERRDTGLVTHVLERTYAPASRTAIERRCELPEWPASCSTMRMPLPAVSRSEVAVRRTQP
jgi:uncharacterized protein with NRDE domain